MAKVWIILFESNYKVVNFKMFVKTFSPAVNFINGEKEIILLLLF